MRIVALFVLIIGGLVLIASAAPGKPSDENSVILAIGVSSMITPIDTVKYYQEIIDYIGERIGRPVRMVHRRTYEEMDRLLEKGEVKVAFICSAPYVKDHDSFGVELLAAPSVYGKASYQSYIIVHKDSPIGSFPELRGKTFAFTDPRSNTGTLYPNYLVKTVGSTPDRFFRKFVYSYSHNKSVELVAKRLADGAAVDSLVYDFMKKKGSPYTAETRIIKRSPPYGSPPVVVAKGFDPALRRQIEEALLSMDKTDRGRAILSGMMIDGFVKVSDSDYDGIRKMERTTRADSRRDVSVRGRKTVYVGIIPRDNPRILYEKYQPLLDYLSDATSYTFEIIQKRRYEDVVSAIGKGEIDLAFMGPLTYLESKVRYGARCILKPRGSTGDATYKSVIVAKSGSAVKGLGDLKGRSVAFAASKSTSGNLVPRHLLANSGIHLEDLSGYKNFDYHDSVVKAIMRGQHDAGAVRESVARKYAPSGIRVIGESGPIPTGPIVAGAGVAPSLVEEMKRALLTLDPKREEHRKVLNRLDDDMKNGFTEAVDSDYSMIRAEFNAVPRTCGRGCHPRIAL